MAYARAGIVAGAGAVQPGDLDLIRQASLQALRLRAGLNPAFDLPVYRDAGVRTFLVQLISPVLGERFLSPDEYVEAFAPTVEAFVRQGVRDFEVQSEPNLAARGYGRAWRVPVAFGEWFLRVAERLKASFGPQVRAGFPALTPPLPRPAYAAEPVISQREFLAACAAAIQGADFVCCHVYWDNVEGMRSPEGGMRFVRQYLEAFPRVPLVISEFANVNPQTDSATKGAQYAEFYFTCEQYDECRFNWPWNQAYWPRLQAAYALIMRSPDPACEGLTWRDPADGTLRPVVGRVAARPRMPEAHALRLAWPTEYRNYTQFYGENQQSYYDNSYAHSLRGGHNGVDLHVRYDQPALSPIRACLAGMVTQKRMLETGYGHHIYVQSEVADVGRVTLLYAHMSNVWVEQGQAIEAGHVVGTAGVTGATTGPHLHLSLKIEGLRLPANGDYLNPRPFLDPLPGPRGRPRTGYVRTYVLLPPAADCTWAEAAAEAGWHAHRWTIGGSADDAGIGDLDVRRVLAVNPAGWGGDLAAFFAEYYRGVLYVPLEAGDPAALKALLQMPLPSPADIPTEPTEAPRGQPRVPYERTYILLPPGAGAAWAIAALRGAWDRRRFTVGGSADDAGIGDLDYRRIIAVNPAAWGDDLWVFYQQHYPGVQYVPLVAETPPELATALGEF